MTKGIFQGLNGGSRWMVFDVEVKKTYVSEPNYVDLLAKVKKKGPLNNQGAFKKDSAATYSPTQSPAQYHRR